MSRYLPDVFGENLMDDWMDSFENSFNALENSMNRAMSPLYGRHAKNIMKTDVTEKNGNYEIAVDLPGFRKDEVNLSLEDGYLTISTDKNLDKEEKDKKGNVIRHERYAGNMARSFYVGEDVSENDVHAKFEDGVLHVTVPEKEAHKGIPEQKHIRIA